MASDVSVRPVEAYETAREIIVLGRPKPNDDSHNCDVLGCGSTGPHVLYRFLKPEPEECLCGEDERS